jgi:hypothetical protein
VTVAVGVADSLLKNLNMAKRLRGVGIAFAICFITAPIAIILTIALIPFWSWIESKFKIESIGHSGPAEWCYVVCYIIILACASLIWWAIRRRADIYQDTPADAAKPRD